MCLNEKYVSTNKTVIYELYYSLLLSSIKTLLVFIYYLSMINGILVLLKFECLCGKDC